MSIVKLLDNKVVGELTITEGYGYSEEVDVVVMNGAVVGIIDYDHFVIEDDQPVENLISEREMKLLVDALYTSWARPGPFIAYSDVGLFYALDKPAVVPDVMVILDVQLPSNKALKKNKSYFAWRYGKLPEIVVEVVSNRKGNELGSKKALYASLGIQYYIVHDPYRYLSQDVLHVFELSGQDYVPLDEFWLPEVGLGLKRWEGEYLGEYEEYIRWCTQDGKLLLTGIELADQEAERADAMAAENARLLAELAELRKRLGDT